MRNWVERVSKVGSSADILAEERVRRFRWWWIGDWMPGRWLKGRVGLVVAACFCIVGGVWVSFFSGEESGGAVGETGSRAGGPLRGGGVLSTMDANRAERFGEPLFLGEGGLPVVQLRSTGEVRELTPVEWGYDSGLPYVRTGVDGVVWTTGPRGWGMWWREDMDELSVFTDGGFSAELWRQKQESELRWVAGRVTEGLRGVMAMEPDNWRRGNGEVVEGLVREVRLRYSVETGGVWAGVPGRWVCDIGLERDLTQGLTDGCPGSDLLGVVAYAWDDMGAVVDQLGGMARLAGVMDGLGTRELYESELVGDMWYRFRDLGLQVEVLNARLDFLSSESSRVGLPVRVALFDDVGE